MVTQEKKSRYLLVTLLLGILGWSGFSPTVAADEAEQATAAKKESQPLFVARPLTEKNKFTAGIEGPACDAAGNIYAVNFSRQSTIGQVTVGGQAKLFVDLPAGSTGNGIRFNQQGEMFVADYTGHNVLRVDLKTKKISVLAHEEKMNQPNDLTIAPDVPCMPVILIGAKGQANCGVLIERVV